MRQVLVSTTSFESNSLGEIFRLAKKHKLPGVELSGNLEYLTPDELRHLFDAYHLDLDILIHNYAPVPKVPFVLNLGHSATFEKSMAHCTAVLNQCGVFGFDTYSVHAGMTFNPVPKSLGNAQAHYSAMNRSESLELLCKGLHQLADLAAEFGVTILVENNAVPRYNCSEGINTRYHFADFTDRIEMMDILSHPNIGVLMDLAHLKVSAETFNFDREAFLEVYREKIKAVHLSDNDGREDQNCLVDPSSWFWRQVPWKQLRYASLEVKPCSMEVLSRQVSLVVDNGYEWKENLRPRGGVATC